MKPIAVLLLAFLLVLGGCGEDAGPVANETTDRAPLPVLPPVEDAAKARFALDRLLRGPLPRTGVFRIPHIHLRNLEHARADLIALGDATFDLLSDPDLLARLTRADGDRNPWHNVLQVLASLHGAPTGLVLDWCRPALATDDVQLNRRAVRALLTVEDGAVVDPLLLRFLERFPGDRELAPLAFRALIGGEDPWREKALGVALRAGSALFWSHVPTLLEEAPDAGRPTVDALAWWAVLTELSGPTEVRGASRNVGVPWFTGRLIVDDAVWPRDVAGLEAATVSGRILAPAWVVDAGGVLREGVRSATVLAWPDALGSGRATAADARCRLAAAGHAAFRATVLRDLDASDPVLRLTAGQCSGAREDADETLELYREVLDAFVEELEAGGVPDATGVSEALQAVIAATPKAGVAAAVTVLRRARPLGVNRSLLERAHDLLAVTDPAALENVLSELLRSEDVEEHTIALLLVRRGRDVRYAPVLDELLANPASPGEAGLVRRLLIWLYTAPEGVDADARRDFALRFAAWLDALPDAEAAGLAPGLLDLGAPGAAAYAAGLTGPRRSVFLRGLLSRTGLAPYVVLEALLDPVDETTSPQERRAALVAAYGTAPASAAPLLAALRARLAPADRVEVDDVLAVVRHRAERDR